MKTVRILVAAVTGAWFVLACFGGSPALAYPRGYAEDTRLAPIKQLQRRVMLSGAKARYEHWREEQERRHEESKRGTAARKPRPSPEPKPATTCRPRRTARSAVATRRHAGARDRFGAASSAVLAPNVRVNSLTGDAADAGQAEASVAVLGSNILIAWNDGQGSIQSHGHPGLVTPPMAGRRSPTAASRRSSRAGCGTVTRS
jgi:hypothetical protein